MHEMAFQQHMFHVLLLKKISLLREIPSRKIFFFRMPEFQMSFLYKYTIWKKDKSNPNWHL